MNRKLIWQHEEHFGCEHFTLCTSTNNITAQGTIIYEEQKQPHLVTYTVQLDHGWMTKAVTITVNHDTHLELTCGGYGNWFDANGGPLPHLTGAIDIDISKTPFSNSLPVNRLNWEVNEQHHFDVVYISVPSLEVKKVPQSYRYVQSDGKYRYFRYHCYEYETTICVDGQGLIMDYPGVFRQAFNPCTHEECDYG